VPSYGVLDGCRRYMISTAPPNTELAESSTALSLSGQAEKRRKYQEESRKVSMVSVSRRAICAAIGAGNGEKTCVLEQRIAYAFAAREWSAISPRDARPAPATGAARLGSESSERTAPIIAASNPQSAAGARWFDLTKPRERLKSDAMASSGGLKFQTVIGHELMQRPCRAYQRPLQWRNIRGAHVDDGFIGKMICFRGIRSARSRAGAPHHRALAVAHAHVVAGPITVLHRPLMGWRNGEEGWACSSSLESRVPIRCRKVACILDGTK